MGFNPNIFQRFVQQVEEVYYGVIFVQILTSVVSICCTLFSIVIGGWPTAFAYIFYSSVIFYSYCGLGHLVKISVGILSTKIFIIKYRFLIVTE